jgi:hypothetical protein
MCKFQTPNVPQGATADEIRAIMFNALSNLDLSDKCEKRESLTYLSWANAWSEFKSAYPSATYRILKNENGLPYFSDPNLGIMVFTEVTVDDVTHQMWLPVMDSKNKAMKLEPYTYSVWNNFKKAFEEKTVQGASMFDINKTLMRCLVKNLAMFGLGLYIFQGDDLPEKSADDTNSSAPQQPIQRPVQQPVDPLAPIKNAINSMVDVNSLMNLYFDHQNEVEGNPEIKALFTQRRQQLQLLAGRK